MVTFGSLPVVLGDPVQIDAPVPEPAGEFHPLPQRGTAAHPHRGGSRASGEWLFSVQDNGIGIEPQYAEKVFGIFKCLQPRDKYPGSGMGLAICRKIVTPPRRPHLGRKRLGQGRQFQIHAAPVAPAIYADALRRRESSQPISALRATAHRQPRARDSPPRPLDGLRLRQRQARPQRPRFLQLQYVRGRPWQSRLVLLRRSAPPHQTARSDHARLHARERRRARAAHSRARVRTARPRPRLRRDGHGGRPRRPAAHAGHRRDARPAGLRPAAASSLEHRDDEPQLRGDRRH